MYLSPSAEIDRVQILLQDYFVLTNLTIGPDIVFISNLYEQKNLKNFKYLTLSFRNMAWISSVEYSKALAGGIAEPLTF